MFEVTIAGSELVKALSAADKVVSRKPTIPVLGNVLVEVKQGSVAISATDAELAVVSRYPAQSMEDGAVTLPTSTLLNIAKSLPPTEVRLTEAATGVKLVASGFKATLQSLPAADFPSIATPAGATVTISRSWLRDAIIRTRFAVKVGDTRFYLAGGQLEVSKTSGRLRLVATDGHRMAIVDGPAPASDLKPSIMPLKTMNALAAMLEGDGPDVVYSQGENHLFFQAGEQLLVSRLIDGNYPQYERAIPKVADKIAEADRETLVSALRRSAMVVDQSTRRVMFALTKDSIRVSAQSASVGEAAETLASAYDGPDVEIGLNVDYILDFLEAAGTPRVQMSAMDPRSAVTMRSVGGDAAYRYTLMPVVL